LLFRRSKYSAMCQKYTSTDWFFSDFAHWDVTLRDDRLQFEI